MYIVSRGEDAAKLPIMHGAAPNNNYVAQDVSSSGVEKSCFGMPGREQEDRGFCHRQLFHFSSYFPLL